MKLAPFVWEFLTKDKVENIENIYEIDEDFKNIMKEAEKCKRQLNSMQMTEEVFNNVFMQTFKIKDSFGNIVEFELAKNFRIHEFDEHLKQLKNGFNLVMTNNEITRILRPNELKLLVCGASYCPVEKMKKLIVIDVLPSESHVDDFTEYSAKMTTMFWKVTEELSVEERIGFIRFSSGSNGLPVFGMKWKDDLKVMIVSKEQSLKKFCLNLIRASHRLMFNILNLKKNLQSQLELKLIMVD